MYIPELLLRYVYLYVINIFIYICSRVCVYMFLHRLYDTLLISHRIVITFSFYKWEPGSQRHKLTCPVESINTRNCFSVNPTQLGFLLVLELTGKTRIWAQEVWTKNLPDHSALSFSLLLGLASGTELSLPFFSTDSYSLRGSMEVHAALNREGIFF